MCDAASHSPGRNPRQRASRHAETPSWCRRHSRTQRKSLGSDKSSILQRSFSLFQLTYSRLLCPLVMTFHYRLIFRTIFPENRLPWPRIFFPLLCAVPNVIIRTNQNRNVRNRNHLCRQTILGRCRILAQLLIYISPNKTNNQRAHLELCSLTSDTNLRSSQTHANKTRAGSAAAGLSARDSRSLQ